MAGPLDSVLGGTSDQMFVVVAYRSHKGGLNFVVLLRPAYLTRSVASYADLMIDLPELSPRAVLAFAAWPTLLTLQKHRLPTTLLSAGEVDTRYDQLAELGRDVTASALCALRMFRSFEVLYTSVNSVPTTIPALTAQEILRVTQNFSNTTPAPQTWFSRQTSRIRSGYCDNFHVLRIRNQ